MDRLRYEIPTLERKQDAIDYINEFYDHSSKINGSGGLHRYLDCYEEWLLKLENDYKTIPNEERVPAITFFLVRESDNKIVGMINIRLTLNKQLKEEGGHIGYSIRPTERRKGYNKINLYLGLIECQKHGIKQVLMDCEKQNLGSARTMQALGAELVAEYNYKDTIAQKYTINVDEAIQKNKDEYEKCIYVTEKVR